MALSFFRWRRKPRTEEDEADEAPAAEGERRKAPEMTKQQAEMMIMGMIRDEKEKKAHIEHQVLLRLCIHGI